MAGILKRFLVGRPLATTQMEEQRLSKSIALARVPAAVVAGDSVQVAVRDKQLAARVVKPPFVRNGKVLVHDN